MSILINISYIFSSKRTSFDLCVRSFSADLSVSGINISKENAILEFYLMVQGTPPKVEDKWVSLKLLLLSLNLLNII